MSLRIRVRFVSLLCSCGSPLTSAPFHAHSCVCNTEVVDAVLDYPTWFALSAGFLNEQGNLSALVETYQNSQKSYKNGTFSVGSFLENHDQPRYGSLVKDDAVSGWTSNLASWRESEKETDNVCVWL